LFKRNPQKGSGIIKNRCFITQGVLNLQFSHRRDGECKTIKTRSPVSIIHSLIDSLYRETHAFISSWPDYHYVLLSSLPNKAIGQLHNRKNAAAQVLTETKLRAHITPVFKSIHDCAPQYMFNTHFSYVPGRSLRSSDTGLLTIPKPRTKRHGETAFSYYAPRP
jgi:hypothetical protein